MFKLLESEAVDAEHLEKQRQKLRPRREKIVCQEPEKIGELDQSQHLKAGSQTQVKLGKVQFSPSARRRYVTFCKQIYYFIPQQKCEGVKTRTEAAFSNSAGLLVKTNLHKVITLI